MTREDFLKTVWKSYPALPASHNTAGRIVNISDSQARLDLGILIQIPKEWLPILRVGDLISARVESFGAVAELTLLAPLLGRPSAVLVNEDMQKKWNQFLAKVRKFFSEQGFLEVQTPTLVKCPGTEVFLDSFETTLQMGSWKEKLFLPTSPELHLKKLLCQGHRQIFEIKNCFRNGEISATHQPEFYMLEWYRAYSNIHAIKEDLKALIKNLSSAPVEFVTFSMAELFDRLLGLRLLPDTDLITLRAWASDLGLKADHYEDWDDIFHLIYLEKIEPSFASHEWQGRAIIVEKYPPSQAAYARLGSDGWAERFEMYLGGLEICNAFHEVNDPEIQKQRMAADLEKKLALGRPAVELDMDFFQALESGMPPSGGIALGLERLFMALHGVHDISALKMFPYRPRK